MDFSVIVDSKRRWTSWRSSWAIQNSKIVSTFGKVISLYGPLINATDGWPMLKSSKSWYMFLFTSEECPSRDLERSTLSIQISMNVWGTCFTCFLSLHLLVTSPKLWPWLRVIMSCSILLGIVFPLSSCSSTLWLLIWRNTLLGIEFQSWIGFGFSREWE